MARNKAAKAASAAKAALSSLHSEHRLAVEYRPRASLIPSVNNARTHSAKQLQQIAESIRRFGMNDPIGVRGDTIVTGHGTWAATGLLNMTTVPVTPLDHLSETQMRAYMLAHNRIAMSAGWDDDLLKVELGELRVEGVDPADLGFNEAEVARLIGGAPGLTDENEVPPVPENPVARPGDVWLMGAHRLVCGDATVKADVDKALNGVKPLLMVTDPPYGVDYDPKWRDAAGIVERIGQTSGGAVKTSTGAVANDGRADWRAAWLLFPGDVAYVWHGMLHSAAVVSSLEESGFLVRAEIVWRKQHHVMSRGDYHAQHESAWYVVRKGRPGGWTGDRKQSTIWDIANANPMGGANADFSSGHGTQKPVECMRRPMENNSSPGQAVYEPFNGSGSTLIAAEQSGRVCHAVEIDPSYVDVAILRWQNFTGQNAILEATGQTFTEVLGDRVPGKVLAGAAPKKRRGAKRK